MHLQVEVCHDVAIELIRPPVKDNNLAPSTANPNDRARLDVNARSFWNMGQNAFFDISAFDPKTSYNRRILEVEYASFTPLIFTIHGAMDIECRSFVSKFSDLLQSKQIYQNPPWLGSHLTKSSTMAINDIDVRENLTKIIIIIIIIII